MALHNRVSYSFTCLEALAISASRFISFVYSKALLVNLAQQWCCYEFDVADL